MVLAKDFDMVICAVSWQIKLCLCMWSGRESEVFLSQWIMTKSAESSNIYQQNRKILAVHESHLDTDPAYRWGQSPASRPHIPRWCCRWLCRPPVSAESLHRTSQNTATHDTERTHTQLSVTRQKQWLQKVSFKCPGLSEKHSAVSGSCQ